MVASSTLTLLMGGVYLTSLVRRDFIGIREGSQGLSERDEPGEKITVLFPSFGGEEAPTEAEEGASGAELLSEEEAGEEGAKVVQLDFRRRGAPAVEEPQVPSELSLSAEDRSKLTIFRRIIEDGMVMVTLDTRVEGVDVPPKFRGLPELRLNFSHLFQLPDFEYDAAGVRGSLSFQGERYRCVVPWGAVFMLYSHETSEVFVFEL